METLNTLFDVAEPVAVVTGSALPRVGQVTARRLHQLGCRVALHANGSLQQAKETAERWSTDGPETIALQADLSDASQVEHLSGQVLERWGRIDILVHAAAIWSPRTLEETTPEDLDRYYQVNQKATFLITQSVGLSMTRQPRGGAIVLMGDWALQRPYLDYAAYFMSKASIPTLTRVFAVELAHRNPRVRVNAVLPGPVTLPDHLSDEQHARAVQGTLRKAEGSPEDIASAAVCLIENHYLTGVCLPVDGGRSIYSPDDDYKRLG